MGEVLAFLGVAGGAHRLAEYFAREQRAGRLLLGSPAVIANCFHMMVFGNAVISSTAGTVDAGDLAWIKADTRKAVAIFVRGMQPAATGATPAAAALA